MELWTVRLLGSAQAWGSSEESAAHATGTTIPVHLRSRPTWALLASLLLEPQTRSRGTLAVRFWPGGDERKSLGMAVSSLRQAFGDDAILADRDTLRLDPTRFTTDVERIVACERWLTAGNGLPEERLALLLETAEQIGGILLADYDLARDPTGWVGHQRAVLQARCLSLLATLSDALRTAGHQGWARDWDQRAAALFPDCEEAAERAWRSLADGYDQRVVAATESGTLARIASLRLARLSDPHRDALARLTVFPDVFTATEATTIVGVENAVLAVLRLAGFVFPAGGTTSLGLLLIPDEVRRAAAPLLPRSRAGTLLEAYCRHLLTALTPPAPSSDPAPTWESLKVVVAWLVGQPFSVEGGHFVTHLCERGLPEDFTDSTLLLDWCTRASEKASLTPSLRCDALLCGAHLARALRRFSTARLLLLRLLDFPAPDHKEDETPLAAGLLIELAIACHHAEEAQEAIQSAQEAIRLCRGHAPEQAGALYILAEALSVDDSAAAVSPAAEALALRRREDPRPEALAASLYQLGTLLATVSGKAGGGDLQAAGAALDEALSLFEGMGDAHGVADCLRTLARVHADEGRWGESFFFAREAIRRYGEIGAGPSRAAALGTLGELLHRRGDKAGARRCYEEGLAVWRALPHQRWIARFETALDSLEEF